LANVDDWARMCKVWNEGLELYGVIPVYGNGFEAQTTGGYFTGEVSKLYSNDWLLKPSLFNFLYFANLETIVYDNWIFTGMNRKNLVLNL